ncbi:MAG TPA: hypothetical protein VNO26_13935 [Candidatus Limnocylindria bacterium]|nr:hypothetical protein [Candidatus Limnocylindria bacterium]
MTNRFKVGVVVALAAALATGPMLGSEAWAGKKKSSIKARINDAKFKVNRKPGATAAGGSYDDITGILNIVGGSAKLSGRGLNTTVDLKVLSLTTTVDNLATAAFPLTVPVELTTFSRVVNQAGVPISTEIWAGEGITLTITSYKDGRIKATFEGTIPAEEGAAADAIVEDGKLSVLLNAPAI